MRTEHPEWFSEAQESPTTLDIMRKLAKLEERLEQVGSFNKSFWRK
jgi:hypothetical protein